MLKIPQEVMLDIAKRAKVRRLALNLTQQGVAARSGVSFGSVKRFEKSGLISIESLLKIALVLDSLQDFEKLFVENADATTKSLDAIIKSSRKRKRGTKS